MDYVKSIFQEAASHLSAFSTDENFIKIDEAAGVMASSLAQGGQIISCGNGGSMSDAMHFAEELTGNFQETRNPLKASAISDPAYLTCTANDFGFDQVFSRYVEAHGTSGDVLLAISTSGDSANVMNAAQKAKSQGMKVIGLTGKDGGSLASICDVEIRGPHSQYSDRIQEIHIKVIHALIQGIEVKLNS